MKCDIKDCKGEAKYKTKNGWCVCATHKIQILDETEPMKAEPTKDEICEVCECKMTSHYLRDGKYYCSPLGDVEFKSKSHSPPDATENELIAEFEKEISSIWYSWANGLLRLNTAREKTEQAARNLIIDVQYDMSRVNAKVVNKGYLEGIKVGKQKMASAISLEMNILENVAKLNPNQIITYGVIWNTLKKHLSETE